MLGNIIYGGYMRWVNVIHMCWRYVLGNIVYMVGICVGAMLCIYGGDICWVTLYIWWVYALGECYTYVVEIYVG